jgi:hypothetical protein
VQIVAVRETPLGPLTPVSSSAAPSAAANIYERWLRGIAERIGDEEPPDELCCPLSHSLMQRPVRTCNGSIYERSVIEVWFGKGNTRDPMTNIELDSTRLVPDIKMRNSIAQWLERTEFDRALKLSLQEK